MIKELLSAAVGTIAFSLLYAVPKKHYLDCGVIGAAGWLVYRLMLVARLSQTFSVFFAVVLIVRALMSLKSNRCAGLAIRRCLPYEDEGTQGP